jgi:hypothetical protein
MSNLLNSNVLSGSVPSKQPQVRYLRLAVDICLIKIVCLIRLIISTSLCMGFKVYYFDEKFGCMISIL